MRTAILVSRVLGVAIRLLSLVLLGTETAAAGEAWQTEWSKIVAEAKREGQLAIIAEETHSPVLEDFRKKYPEIRVSLIGGPSGRERTQKLMAERRAELYLRDIYIGNIYSDLGEGIHQVCDPIAPTFILPEVVDESKWWKGKHHYFDPKGQYVFVYEGVIKVATIAYNKNLVNPQAINSYWDLLNAKWKGKIVAIDHRPKAMGSVQDGFRLFYFHPELGPDFVRRLYSEMDITFSRNQTQILDWLGVGKVALAFFNATTDVNSAIRQGLPIGEFLAPNFKEGGIVGPQVGRIALLNRAPHPNVAKLFINWLLSKEGQVSFQNAFAPRSQGQHGNSMREDIPKDIIPLSGRRQACRNCMEGILEMQDVTPITKFIDDVLAQAKK